MLASLLISLVGLETLARVLDPTPAPVYFRGDVYINTLPLVNGETSGIGDLPAERVPLREEKAADELRIVVLGESSTQGFPGGAEHSPVTLLQEQLRLSHPKRRFTLINLGRCGAVTRDGYYYLLYARRFQPDAVLFYMGTNDCCSMDGELCLPLEHPDAHARWRWAVEHSQTLWLARAFGPQLLRSRLISSRSGGGNRPLCDLPAALERWTELLLDTALAIGAKPLVSLPVFSQHARIEYWERAVSSSRAHDTWEGPSSPLDPDYKALLECRLDPSCDFPEKLEAFLAKKDSEHSGRTGNDFPAQLEQAWQQAALSRQVPVIDPSKTFLERSTQGVIGPPVVLDNVHLSVDGAWTLAQTWHKALIPLLGLPDAEPTPAAASSDATRQTDPESARADFLARMGGQGKAQLIEEGFRLLGRRHPFFALSYFEHAQSLAALEQQLNAQDSGIPCATLTHGSSWAHLQRQLPHFAGVLEKSLQRPSLRGSQPQEAATAEARAGLQHLQKALPGLVEALTRSDPALKSLLQDELQGQIPAPHGVSTPTLEPGVSPMPTPGALSSTPTGATDAPFAVRLEGLAQVGAAWVRQRSGLPHGLTPDLEPALLRLEPGKPVKMTENGWACLPPKPLPSSTGGITPP